MTSGPDTVPQGSVLRYSNAAVAFHWLTAAFVLVQAWLGWLFSNSEPGPARDEVFVWHKSIGVVILLVVVARLFYRLRNPPPPFPAGLPGWQRVAAVWNHRLFYTLLIAMPIVGWVAVSGYANSPLTPLVGGVHLPVFPSVSKAAGELAGEVHEIAAKLLIALILLHVAAALKHQFVGRWSGAARMPPFSSKGAPVISGQGRGGSLQEG